VNAAPSPRAPIVVIAAGLLAAGLGWPRELGYLPFTLLFKNQLALPAYQVALFWAVGTVAWYAKPLVGLLCDAVPLFGTRRRGYLVAGAAAAGACWLAFALLPRAYLPFLANMVVLNLALVVVSVVVDGLLVEVGQRHGATGRLSSLRMILTGAVSLLAGPLGGWLAARPFDWTAGAGAALLLAFVPIAARLCREAPAPVRAAATSAGAGRHLRAVVSSRPTLAMAGLLFVAYVVPGFGVPLTYYEADVLGFQPRFMGTLQLVGGAGALAGAAAYALLCRRLPLRLLLVAGIVVNAGSTLFYLGFDSPRAALLITASAAVLGTLAMLPLYDLAARAVPAGSESFGYAVLLTAQTVAQLGISDLLGSYLHDRFHLGLERLVGLNAACTAAVLLYLPVLPRALFARREGNATSAA
jgi:Na+/melibiose symporter-like transporter